MPDPHDVYIVSDLHLCEGWIASEQRYSRLEIFFFCDSELARWLARVIAAQEARGRSALLLLNGDIFTWERVPLLEGYHPSAIERLLPESVPDPNEPS